MAMTQSGRTTWWAAARDTRGSEIAETAMVLPLVFMMLMAIFWFGQAFRIYGTITHAAREGARAAVAPVCATCAAAGNTPAQNAAAAVNNALAAAKLDPTRVQTAPPIAALVSCINQGAVPCDGSVSNMCVQTPVELSNITQGGSAICGTSVSFRYKYPYHFAIPYTGLDLGNITLFAQAQMRVESQ
jgi:hypothetical protein